MVPPREGGGLGVVEIYAYAIPLLASPLQGRNAVSYIFYPVGSGVGSGTSSGSGADTGSGVGSGSDSGTGSGSVGSSDPTVPSDDGTGSGSGAGPPSSGALAPARSISSWRFVMQVSAPLSSPMQSSFVLTRLAKKSQMPLAVSANQAMRLVLNTPVIRAMFCTALTKRTENLS